MGGQGVGGWGGRPAWPNAQTSSSAPGKFNSVSATSLMAQKFRQLGDIRSDAPRLVEENHELVYPESIYSGHSSSQLLHGRFSGCRRYLDYLLIRRTVKHAANFSTDQGAGKIGFYGSH